MLLQAMVKQRRAEAAPYQVTALDLKTAFDTVPHWVITSA